MIVEDFHDGDAGPVYRRLRDEGRLTPEGLTYVDSWVATDMTRCYQVVECEDLACLDEWMSRWSDLVAFEVVPVITSEEASATIAPRL
jgi:hypothetical protein